MDPIICSKCENNGLCLRSSDIKSPVDFIEGDPKSPIWIIGLNPAGPIGTPVKNVLENSDITTKKSKYFRDFKKVSPRLFENWLQGKHGAVAHTDLVKCFTPSFPPKDDTNSRSLWKTQEKNEIIENCASYLREQINNYKPRIIICNGSPVSEYFLRNFPADETLEENETLLSYSISLGDQDARIFLTGFIGRIDDRSKRRLGLEIEQFMQSVIFES